MARTATVRMEDPVASRVAVLSRVKARRPPDKVRSYPSTTGDEPLVSRTPSETDRLPPRTLADWVDDRTVATFGGRTKLNAAEQCAFEILEAFRSADQAAVRKAVQAAGKGIDSQLQHLVYALLETWRGGAPGYALDVTIAATGEARRLGWDVQPRRRRRAA
jgi:hypothetical protein